MQPPVTRRPFLPKNRMHGWLKELFDSEEEDLKKVATGRGSVGACHMGDLERIERECLRA